MSGGLRQVSAPRSTLLAFEKFYIADLVDVNPTGLYSLAPRSCESQAPGADAIVPPALTIPLCRPESATFSPLFHSVGTLWSDPGANISRTQSGANSTTVPAAAQLERHRNLDAIVRERSFAKPGGYHRLMRAAASGPSPSARTASRSRDGNLPVDEAPCDSAGRGLRHSFGCRTPEAGNGESYANGCNRPKHRPPLRRHRLNYRIPR